MKELNCDLHIVGGALTGLLTAYCASSWGYSIIISEKKNILAGTKKATKDKRTTAIAEGSKNFLESQSLWRQIKAFAEPIHNSDLFLIAEKEIKRIESSNEDITKFKPLIKLYDRADIINDIV